ncbi:GAF domain-containing protein [bacterium]|nr:GAF domain-containing protein [bacterium]
MLKNMDSVENITTAEQINFLDSCYSDFLTNGKFDKLETVKKFHKYFVAIKNFELASISMSLLAMCQMKEGQKSYYETLLLLNDAKFLATSVNSALANKFNLIAQGYVEYLNKNSELALESFIASQSLQTLFEPVSMHEVNGFILKLKRELETEKIASNQMTFIPPNPAEDPFLALLKVGRTISVETNLDNLLNIIAQEIRHALNADRCTVFMLDEERQELWSKIATGVELKEIRFSVNSGIAGYVAKTGETVNIDDVYSDSRFNKEIDQKTEYKTRNVLCMPIVNIKHEIVGVFQVLNKKEGSFTQKDEDVLIAIGATAGIALDNAALFDKQQRLIEEQSKLMSSFIDTLSASLDARDKITSGHSKRVTMYSVLIAEALGMSEKEIDTIKQAALLHDIGKIGVKDSILQKEGKLTDEEYANIKQHANLTHSILSKVYASGEFKDIVDIASSHHEKFDGSGYFRGAKETDIPLGGRILAVADVFDAITSKRHYRSRMEIEKAVGILIDSKGKHFDPNLVDLFLGITLDKLVEIFIDGTDIQVDLRNVDILAKYNLKNIHDYILLGDDKSDKEKQIVEIFSEYYYARS